MIGKRKRIRKQINDGVARNQFIDPKYLASCYGKIRRTKAEAHAEAELKGGLVKPYKCKYCPHYHVGRKA